MDVEHTIELLQEVEKEVKEQISSLVKQVDEVLGVIDNHEGRCYVIGEWQRVLTYTRTTLNQVKVLNNLTDDGRLNTNDGVSHG